MKIKSTLILVCVPEIMVTSQNTEVFTKNGQKT